MNKQKSGFAKGVIATICVLIVGVSLSKLFEMAVRSDYYSKTGQAFRLIIWSGESFVKAHGRDPLDIDELVEWGRNETVDRGDITDGLQKDRLRLIKGAPHEPRSIWIIYFSERNDEEICALSRSVGAMWYPNIWALEQYLNAIGRQLEYHSVGKRITPMVGIEKTHKGSRRNK